MKNSKRLAVALIPLCLVNVIAVSGQLAFIRENWGWTLYPSVGAAIAIESIAVYLAFMAHEALLAEDSAFGLKLGSYGMGIIAGLMNASHYMPHWVPTSKGIVLGILSASSPFLWAIYTKRVSRDALKAKGLIEPRAVKLGALRWILWPSRAFPVFRNAVWTGTNEISTAISQWEESESATREAREAEIEAKRDAMTLETAETQADAIRIALAALPESATNAEVLKYLASAQPRSWSVQSARVRQVRATVRDAQQRAEAESRRSAVRMLPGAIASGQG